MNVHPGGVKCVHWDSFHVAPTHTTVIEPASENAHNIDSKYLTTKGSSRHAALQFSGLSVVTIFNLARTKNGALNEETLSQIRK